MSIKTKLLSVIIGIIVIIISAAGIFIHRQYEIKLTEHYFSGLKNTVSHTSQLVNFYFDRVEDSLSNLANDSLMAAALETRNTDQLTRASDRMTVVSETITNVVNVGLEEIKGSSCIMRSGDKEITEFFGSDFSTRDYCQGIIKTQKNYYSSAFMSPITEVPVLSLAVPVKNTKGKMTGFIVGTIDLSELRGYLWDLQKDSSVILLDRYGTAFLDTTKKIDTLDDPPAVIVGEVKKRLAENNNEGHLQNMNNLVSYKFDGKITVVYIKSSTELLSLLRTLDETVFSAIFVAILFVMVLIYFLINTFTKRVFRLTKIAYDVAKGQFSAKLDKKDLTATDEIAVLARALNDMAVKLSDVYKNLEDKVRQRKAELDEKTRKLEISEKELKKTLDTSERLNKLMVGRELEMIKLKKQIEKINGK